MLSKTLLVKCDVGDVLEGAERHQQVLTDGHLAQQELLDGRRQLTCQSLHVTLQRRVERARQAPVAHRQRATLLVQRFLKTLCKVHLSYRKFEE